MNQPIWPISPFERTSTTDFCFCTYCLYWSTWFQSSSTASTRPLAIASNTGISVISVTFTLQPRNFSSMYLAPYVLAVEPAHACSLSVTVPQLAPLRAPAVPTTASAATSAAPATAATTRTRLVRRRFDIRPSSFTSVFPPCSDVATPLAVALRDPVERDPEREDRERRDDAQPELVALQPLRHLVAERARADEPRDHDDGEHNDQALVDAEHDRVA